MIASASSRLTSVQPPVYGLRGTTTGPGRGWRRDVNVRIGDRVDLCRLDRPAHLALSGIDGQACGSAAVEVPLIRYTLGGDLCLASEVYREWSTT